MATRLLSVPAGRSFRRQGTNWVDPQPEKGLIELSFEDDLMHLCWKNRTTNSVEDDLIIFGGEATFEKVQQDTTGRTHILKFSSSDQKYFFWFQNRSNEGDLRAEVDINCLLQDPSYRPGSAPLPDRPSTPATAVPAQEERSWPPTPGAPLLSHPEPGPPTASSSSAPAASAEPNQDMARMFMEWAQSGSLGDLQEDAHLTDVLSPSNITNLVRSNPNIVETLRPLLPNSLPTSDPPTAEELIPILTAPQFTDAVASLDNALRSGGLPAGMMRELGLPDGAGSGVKQFLDALKGLSKKDDEDHTMDQD